MNPCIDCGADTACPSRFCTVCLTARVTKSRADQGLPPTIEDPKVLRRIERIAMGEAA